MQRTYGTKFHYRSGAPSHIIFGLAKYIRISSYEVMKPIVHETGRVLFAPLIPTYEDRGSDAGRAVPTPLLHARSRSFYSSLVLDILGTMTIMAAWDNSTGTSSCSWLAMVILKTLKICVSCNRPSHGNFKSKECDPRTSRKSKFRRNLLSGRCAL